MENNNIVFTSVGTGIESLDRLLHGILPGDMITWGVDSMNDFVFFSEKFSQRASILKRKFVYFNFARFARNYKPLISSKDIDVIKIDPAKGFEITLSTVINKIIESQRGTCFLFDLVSELSEAWYSDRMLSNFLMMITPALYDIEATTYLPVKRNFHMKIAEDSIDSVSKVVIDIYSNSGNIFILPKKVNKRYSESMYTMHKLVGDDFVPVTNSSVISEILSRISQPWLDSSMQHLDRWSICFIKARNIVLNNMEEERKKSPLKEREENLYNTILDMSFSKDSNLKKLASKYLRMEDLIEIGQRMVGSGLIGGKSAGMLLARAILKRSDPKWNKLMEVHDSFFVGSDTFYTYLIHNKCWWIVRKLQTTGDITEEYDEIKQRILKGTFSAEMKEQFVNILEYYGQSPIIVRSSSLLEDAYGNSFSGKYDSVFCTNTGTPKERLEEFMNAVRIVYASTMNKDSLIYRKKRGLLKNDEQMALLIQRVSGEKIGNYYFPHAAGVGFSFNPYSWDEDIDPNDGILRLVMGLGTRAVDRLDDDYTRIVSLSQPSKRPEHSSDEIRKYTQHKVDLLNLSEGKLESKYFEDVARSDNENRIPLDQLADVDEEIEERALMYGKEDVFAHVLTFNKLLTETNFPENMKNALATLEKAYGNAVDIEFTLNFTGNNDYKINLVQCRPFQGKNSNIKSYDETMLSPDPDKIEDKILYTKGPVIGIDRDIVLDKFIYVKPTEYSNLTENEKTFVARLIGKLTNRIDGKKSNILLAGPGRWGSTTPSLGVPVSFSEISRVSVLCEIAVMHEGLVPDISLGTHFFNDLIEMEIMYIAVTPNKKGAFFSESLLLSNSKNIFTKLLPEYSSWEKVVHVARSDNNLIYFKASSALQYGISYFKRGGRSS